MNKQKNEVIFVHQNLISNRLTYLVHAESTGELISFGFSDRSVRNSVSAKRSANRWDQTKKRFHFLAYLWSQSEFRTQRNAERKFNAKSEVTQCNTLTIPIFSPDITAISFHFCVCSLLISLCLDSKKQIHVKRSFPLVWVVRGTERS